MNRAGSISSQYCLRHSTTSSASAKAGAATLEAATGVSPAAAILSPSRPERVPSRFSASWYCMGKAHRVKVSYCSMNSKV